MYGENSPLHICSQVINEFVNITSKKIKNPVNFEKEKNLYPFFPKDIFL